ncbi:MAG: phage head closure protein [Sphaerochaetaceae bacterium]|nr:phage head closure protein [Sphaerochaetaceae bacterium]
MRFCEIEIGNLVETEDHGETVKTYEFRTILAKKKSIRSSEFYQAATAGMKPELTFEIYVFEFNNDEVIKYNGKIYTIIRTYEDEKKKDKIELVATSTVGEGAM